MLAHGSPEQIDRWLRPGLRGESQDAYAVTEEHAGSDPSGIATTARPHRRAAGVIDGEKWFVTSGDVRAVYIVVANVIGRRRAALPTLFLVEAGAPGIEIVDDPPFTHAYPHGHPTVRFTGVEVPDDAVLGGVGAGDDLQRAWFTEERLGIAARGVRRDVAAARGVGRVGDDPRAGRRADLRPPGRLVPAGRLRGRRRRRAARSRSAVCALADDAAADPKLVHGKASMAKLFVSERAWACADRAVQTFGGRGYLRTNVAERFLRELRVDRIWEGTSEIQRLIVARSMERRGVERLIH